MAYIGKTPTIGNFQVCDAISVVNGQAAYTMQVGGVNVSPESANHMLVSLNGILQAPTSSFTVSGSTITFASNLVTGDVIDFIQILGNVLDLGVPSDNTVSLAKLTATGTKDSTTFLRGDNTFAVPGGGDFVLIKTQTVALGDGIANVDFVHGTSSVVFDGTYKSYKFILRNFTPANGIDINAQVMLSGTVQTSGYITRNWRSYYSGGNDANNSTSVIAFGNYGMIGSNTVNQSVGYGEFMCGNPTYNGYPEMMSHHSGGENSQKIVSICGGKLQTTTSNWNGVRFKTSDGSNFAGEISLYGIKG